MPQKLHWTEAADTILRRARAEGHSWDSIAAALGVSRWTALERGRRIGARRPPPEFVPKPDMTRGPLPSGHPRSWGPLVQGTCLEGVAYPEPVFEDESLGGARPTPASPPPARRGSSALAANSAPEKCAH